MADQVQNTTAGDAGQAATLFQNFELGLAGALDSAVSIGTHGVYDPHLAASVYASQTATDSSQADQLYQAAAAAEDSGALASAAEMTGEQVASAPGQLVDQVSNFVGSSQFMLIGGVLILAAVAGIAGFFFLRHLGEGAATKALGGTP